MSNRLPRAAVFATLKVADFDRWYAGFTKLEPLRRKYGIVGHHLNRIRGDGNLVALYLAVEDLDAAKRFLKSDDLKAAFKETGVQGAPVMLLMKPRSEDVVWDRNLPAIIVRHEVKDYLRWQKIYEVAAAVRSKHGILGDATNTLLDDSKTVIVYHQAESFEALESFLSDPELKESMKLAGVLGEPDVTFATGGWAKMYTAPEVAPEGKKKADTTHTHA